MTVFSDIEMALNEPEKVTALDLTELVNLSLEKMEIFSDDEKKKTADLLPNVKIYDQ